jgi:hypothetical protein
MLHQSKKEHQNSEPYYKMKTCFTQWFIRNNQNLCDLWWEIYRIIIHNNNNWTRNILQISLFTFKFCKKKKYPIFYACERKINGKSWKFTINNKTINFGGVCYKFIFVPPNKKSTEFTILLWFPKIKWFFI